MSILSADSRGFSPQDATVLGDQSRCYTEHRYMGGVLHMKPSWLPGSIGGKNLIFVGRMVKINPLKPSGQYMYSQFNIQQFYVFPTVYLCVLCGSENKQRLFPYTALTDWFL